MGLLPDVINHDANVDDGVKMKRMLTEFFFLISHIFMCSDFSFPPSTAEVDGLSCDEIKRKDLQVN